MLVWIPLNWIFLTFLQNNGGFAMFLLRKFLIGSKYKREREKHKLKFDKHWKQMFWGVRNFYHWELWQFNAIKAICNKISTEKEFNGLLIYKESTLTSISKFVFFHESFYGIKYFFIWNLFYSKYIILSLKISSLQWLYVGSLLGYILSSLL